jgi:Flp pilus assembly pilin Flp
VRKALAIIAVTILVLLEGVCTILEGFFDKASTKLYRATDKVIAWSHK